MIKNELLLFYNNNKYKIDSCQDEQEKTVYEIFQRINEDLDGRNTCVSYFVCELFTANTYRNAAFLPGVKVPPSPLPSPPS